MSNQGYADAKQSAGSWPPAPPPDRAMPLAPQDNLLGYLVPSPRGNRAFEPARMLAHPYRVAARDRLHIDSTMRPQHDDPSGYYPSRYARMEHRPLYRGVNYQPTTYAAQVRPLQSSQDSNSSGNSLETQQWSDADGHHRVPSTQSETSPAPQSEGTCRVSWCGHAAKRHGLCWAHGGVKKCCHRNCPKIAAGNGEFCSIHDREVTTNSF